MGVLSIVMPAYNEAMRIVPMLSDLQKVHAERPGLLHEVIIVDDGSRDQTVERVLEYTHRLPLKVVRLQKNGGKWTAVRAGLREVRGTVVCIMDADASVFLSEEVAMFGRDPDEWVSFAEMLREKRAVLCGSRFHKKSNVEGKSLVRRVVSQGYRVFVRSAYRYATGRRAPDDMQCPFKVYHASLMEGKLEFLTAEKFAGDIELLFVMAPDVCVDVPLHFIHRRGSKIQTGTALEMFRQTVRFAKREKYLNKFIYNSGVIRASGAGTRAGKGGKT